MIAADLARAVLVLVLVAKHDTTMTAFAVAFGLSTATIVFNPAAASLVPDVVDDDELVTANTALWTSAVASWIVLASLAGAVIAAFDVGAAFAVNAVSYVLSALFLSRLRAGRSPGDITVAGWRSVREGIAAVRSHPLLARLAVVQVLASLSAGATSGLLVVLAAENLGVGASGFGALLAAIGVGAGRRPHAAAALDTPSAAAVAVRALRGARWRRSRPRVHDQPGSGRGGPGRLWDEHLDGDDRVPVHGLDRGARADSRSRLRPLRRCLERRPPGLARYWRPAR